MRERVPFAQRLRIARRHVRILRVFADTFGSIFHERAHFLPGAQLGTNRDARHVVETEAPRPAPRPRTNLDAGRDADLGEIDLDCTAVNSSMSAM